MNFILTELVFKYFEKFYYKYLNETLAICLIPIHFLIEMIELKKYNLIFILLFEFYYYHFQLKIVAHIYLFNMIVHNNY